MIAVTKNGLCHGNGRMVTLPVNGWLLPYSEELGPPKGLISLMAVMQKQKVRLVLDY